MTTWLVVTEENAKCKHSRPVCRKLRYLESAEGLHIPRVQIRRHRTVFPWSDIAKTLAAKGHDPTGETATCVS